jgi:cytochrome c-type biogenesis protein CcmF
LFFVFIGLTFAISVWLLSKRWADLSGQVSLTSFFSRESLFLYNNLAFMAILVVCFWGVVFPIVSEASGLIGDAVPALSQVFTGQKITVGPIFYERATGPIWAFLLLLMGVAPLSAWGASTIRSLGRKVWRPSLFALLAPIGLIVAGIQSWAAILAFTLVVFVAAVTLYDFWQGVAARMRSKGEKMLSAFWSLVKRDRRRYGGYTIHLGIVLMAVGIIGIEIFQKETQGTIPLGGELAIGDYSVRYDSLAEFETDDGRSVARAALSVFKDGEYLTELNPRRDFYFESQQAMTIPGVRSSIEDDFYILLVDWQPISTQNATFKIYQNPLVNWLWFGSLVLIVGTIVAAWPDKDPEYVREARRLRVHAPASAD